MIQITYLHFGVKEIESYPTLREALVAAQWSVDYNTRMPVTIEEDGKIIWGFADKNIFDFASENGCGIDD